MHSPDSFPETEPAHVREARRTLIISAACAVPTALVGLLCADRLIPRPEAMLRAELHALAKDRFDAIFRDGGRLVLHTGVSVDRAMIDAAAEERIIDQATEAVWAVFLRYHRRSASEQLLDAFSPNGVGDRYIDTLLRRAVEYQIRESVHARDAREGSELGERGERR